MKEYEVSFDDFRVDKKNLLGGEEGKGVYTTDGNI